MDKKISFQITDIDGVNSLIYAINEVEDVFETDKPILEKLEKEETKYTGYTIKKFFLDSEDRHLIIISILDNKIVVNGGYVKKGILNISTKPQGIIFQTIEVKKDEKYFIYESTNNRRIFLIDINKCEEVEIEEVIVNKGDKKEKVLLSKIVPGNKYLAIEYRKERKRVLATGICKFINENKKYIAVIEDREAKRIDYDRILEQIELGNKKEIRVTQEIELER